MISALTVTYGDRRKYLEIVLRYIEDCKEIDEIFVVGNGALYDLDEFIRQNGFTKSSCVVYNENKGSAFAFAEGLKHLTSKNSNAFVFILDDDNLPKGNALNSLIHSWDQFSNQFEKDQIMLASLRKDRSYLVNVASGAPERFCFPQSNAFLGFDISRVFDIISWKLFPRSKYRGEHPNKDFIKIPMAPYGGLFFHLSVLQKIGYPNEAFFVYVDDFDFTYRLTKLNGSIFLIPKAEIEDLDESWLNKTRQGFLQSRYFQQNDFRAYLSVRNFTFFVKHNLVKKVGLFNINRRIYLIYLFIISLFSKRIPQYKLIKTAVNDGMQDNLGSYKHKENASS